MLGGFKTCFISHAYTCMLRSEYTFIFYFLFKCRTTRTQNVRGKCFIRAVQLAFIFTRITNYHLAALEQLFPCTALVHGC